MLQFLLKFRVALLLLLSGAGTLQAQNPDTIDSHSANTSRPILYPDHLVSQFAGNIGMFSAGVGYSYARDKVQTEFLYGFVPAFRSHTSIHILTAKTSFVSRSRIINKTYSWVPVRAGAGISYSVGRQFFTQLPKRYPSGYYWFSTSFRLTPFVGSSFQIKLKQGRTSFKKLEVYGDIGT
ncbi:MAG: hypothetical protein EOP49_37195, partial [Sphingobacteriales bacterium]